MAQQKTSFSLQDYLSKRQSGDLWSLPQRNNKASFWRTLSPSQLFVLSFLLLVALGTIGFKTLPGLYTGEPLGWLDALFTATSAVCVTGLIVVDTATYFTTVGQAYILLLIQLGGLGIISFTTLIIVALGRRLSLRHEMLAAGAANLVPEVDYRQLTRDVFRFTFTIEAVGAVLIYLFWIPRFGWIEASWHALFHSISAFCNAGFSTFSDSLMGFQYAPLTQAVVMALIVIGGLGFLTLEELYLWRKAKINHRRFSLSLHSCLVLATTALLIVGGWIMITFLEWRSTLQDMPVWARLLNGLFSSITTRTAGFNTINYGEAATGTNFLTILLMSIGGSPGSTAGGIKTTTVAVLGLLAWSRWRGRGTTSIWHRSIPDGTLQRATGLFVIAFGLMTAGIFVLASVETPNVLALEITGGFLEHMFEAVSAFNTVGLSMGPTPHLTLIGKGMVILLMFIGRVGPLTFAAALSKERPTPPGGFRYANEDVVVG